MTENETLTKHYITGSNARDPGLFQCTVWKNKQTKNSSTTTRKFFLTFSCLSLQHFKTVQYTLNTAELTLNYEEYLTILTELSFFKSHDLFGS